MPHSEKSNDSSDVDSVHSLPIDDLNMPISYADIAKNSEKLKEKKASPEKIEKIPLKEKSPCFKVDQEIKVQQNPKKSPNIEKNSPVEKNTPLHPIYAISKSPPDVNSMKNFPAISSDYPKISPVIPSTVKHSDAQDVLNKPVCETKPHDISTEVQHTPKAITNVTPPSTEVASSTKNTPPSEPPYHQVPKNLHETVSPKNLPPDVHNIRNFPAMPNANKNLNVSEKVTNNTKIIASSANSNKIRNVSPGNNNSGNTNNNKCSNKAGQNISSTINNNVKSNTRNASHAVHNDIINDLTVSIFEIYFFFAISGSRHIQMHFFMLIRYL